MNELPAKTSFFELEPEKPMLNFLFRLSRVCNRMQTATGAYFALKYSIGLALTTKKSLLKIYIKENDFEKFYYMMIVINIIAIFWNWYTNTNKFNPLAIHRQVWWPCFESTAKSVNSQKSVISIVYKQRNAVADRRIIFGPREFYHLDVVLIWCIFAMN